MWSLPKLVFYYSEPNVEQFLNPENLGYLENNDSNDLQRLQWKALTY